MSKLTDFIAQHDAEDQATAKLLAEVQAGLTTARSQLAAALADDAADDAAIEAAQLEASKLRAQVAVLEQWKREHELPEPPPPAPAARFPGDPGKGKYMVGVALGPFGRNSIVEVKKTPQWNDKTQAVHDYASGGAKCLDHGSIKEILDAGMLVASQSFKCGGVPGTTALEKFRYINAGKNDAEIRLSARFCKTFVGQFIWLCLYHEPEDNLTDATTQKEFRLATQRHARIFDEEGVTNVAWGPIYMVPWTWETTRDFRVWHADYTGTGWDTKPTVDFFGMDVYNPLPHGIDKAPGSNRSFREMVVTKAEAGTKKVSMPQVPKIVFEYGYGRKDIDWVAYGNETVEVNREADIVCLFYWDSSADVAKPPTIPYSRYSLLDPKKKAGWDRVVAGAIPRVV